MRHPARTACPAPGRCGAAGRRTLRAGRFPPTARRCAPGGRYGPGVSSCPSRARVTIRDVAAAAGVSLAPVMVTVRVEPKLATPVLAWVAGVPEVAR